MLFFGILDYLGRSRNKMQAHQRAVCNASRKAPISMTRQVFRPVPRW